MGIIPSMDGTMKKKPDAIRQFVNVPVILSHSSFGEIRGISGGVSDTGLFVVVPNKPRLPIGAHIKLQFPKAAITEVIFNTRVVRTTDTGFGLVFVDYEYNGERFKVEQLKDLWKPVRR